jgi:formylglycine-generating enzyme required for sulfatase activity
MILIPAGPFSMGSTQADIEAAYEMCEIALSREECVQQGFESEMPQHNVVLNSYYIDQFEVTNGQFAAFLNDMGNQTEGGAPWLDAGDENVRLALQGGTWQLIDRAFSDHPVTEVTWYGARAFCAWREGRLPTEAEWEKAARWDPDTGESSLYPWGIELPGATLANHSGNVGKTTSIGSYPGGVSPSGVYDMAGNAFEWVADWYAPDYYAVSPELNPPGPDDGLQKVVRGGSWGDFAFLIRASNRGLLAPNVAFNFIGFRCVKDV